MRKTPPTWDIRFEPPYLGVLRVRGDLDAAAVTAIFHGLSSFAAEQGALVLLVDTSQVTSLDPAARKVSLEESHRLPLRGIALCGASFAFRVLVTLVHNAAALVHGERDNPVQFCADEAEGRAWIAARRTAIAAGRR